MEKTRNNRIYGLILAGFVLLFCVLPLITGVMSSGHDFEYHIGRIRELADNISHGKLFSPVYFSGVYETGYASPAFYGDLFLYIPALFVCAGAGVELALRVFLILIAAATAFTSYHCAKKAFGSDLPAFVAAFCFVFSSYFSVDAYTRIALGEAQAFIFLPMIAYGFYSIVFRDGKDKMYLAFGLAGCLLSHVLTAVICVGILAIASLILAKKYFENKKRFIWVLQSAGLFFALTAFFLIPMVEQLASGDFIATNGVSAVTWGTLKQRAMPVSGIFGFFNMGSDSTGSWIPSGLGFFPLVTALLCVFIFIKNKKTPTAALTALVAGLLFLLATTTVVPWGSLQNAFGVLQFPWRLLLFATFFFALSAGAVFNDLRINNRKVFAVLLAVLLFFSWFSYMSSSIYAFEKLSDNAENKVKVTADTSRIGAGEYIPVNEDTFAVNEDGKDASASEYISLLKSVIRNRSNRVISNRLSSSDMTLKRGYGELTVEFSGNEYDDTYIIVPLINYKGYAAYINGEKAEVTDGVYKSSSVKNKNGTYTVSYGKMVRVDVGSVGSGTLTVRYEGTALQYTGKSVTVITVLSLIAYWFLKNRERITALFKPKRAPEPEPGPAESGPDEETAPQEPADEKPEE